MGVLATTAVFTGCNQTSDTVSRVNDRLGDSVLDIVWFSLGHETITDAIMFFTQQPGSHSVRAAAPPRTRLPLDNTASTQLRLSFEKAFHNSFTLEELEAAHFLFVLYFFHDIS